MSFDIANEPAFDPRATCTTCGRSTAAVVSHGERIAGRLVQWQSCFACNAKDEERWTEQRRDEERERLEREERSKRAQERDAARNERQRSA